MSTVRHKAVSAIVCNRVTAQEMLGSVFKHRNRTPVEGMALVSR